VLERAVPGAEASSAAAGILAPQVETEGPGPFLDLCLRSRGLYPAFAEELRSLSGIDVGFLPCGLLKVAFGEEEGQELAAIVAWQKAMGLRADLLAGGDARALEPALSPGAFAAAHFPDDAQVDNRLLVRALSIAAARAGAAFKSGFVRGVIADQGRATGVDLDGEVLRANAVVVAAGSWTGLVPGIGLSPQRVRPVRGQMVQLGLRLPAFRHVLFCKSGYLVPRQDGRVIAGSTMEWVGFEKNVTVQGLAKIVGMAVALCPELAQAPVQDMWAGLRPYTEDRLPLMGAGPMPGLFLATGHFRNGILLAPITARLVSDLVLGRKPPVDPAPFGWR